MQSATDDCGREQPPLKIGSRDSWVKGMKGMGHETSPLFHRVDMGGR